MSEENGWDAATIGSTAGRIWKHLDANGPASLTALVREIGESRDLVMQGVGWLARENKIRCYDERRRRMIALS